MVGDHMGIPGAVVFIHVTGMFSSMLRNVRIAKYRWKINPRKINDLIRA